MNRNELRDLYKNETGRKHINMRGEPEIDYVIWLEDFLVKNLQQAPVSVSLPFDNNTLMGAIFKVYPKGDIRKLAQESRDGRKFYLGDKEIGFRPNDSMTLNQEYIDGFTAGFNYVKNLFIEGSGGDEA